MEGKIKSMKLQVLVAAVGRKPEELLSHMRLQSDAIVINQCDRNGFQSIVQNGHEIRYYDFAEKGVGLSRNNALLRADGDIVLFSDEDIVYDDGYEEKILREFEKNPKADMLLFNIRVSEKRRTYYIEKEGRVRWYNCGRYPTYSFAVRREMLHRNNITFSLLFGGGAKYSNGEDSLFIRDCLKAGLKIYCVPMEIGEETERESTWFTGYHEKFFLDRGVLYHYLYGKFAGLFALRFILLKKKIMCREIPAKKAWNLMKQGIAEAKKKR